MKKRVMKKYIPKHTMYCGDCRWRKHISTIKLHRDTGCQHKNTCDSNCWSKDLQTHCINRIYRCEYLGYTDYEEESLLWDGCKECGVSEM